MLHCLVSCRAVFVLRGKALALLNVHATLHAALSCLVSCGVRFEGKNTVALPSVHVTLHAAPFCSSEEGKSLTFPFFPHRFCLVPYRTQEKPDPTAMYKAMSANDLRDLCATRNINKDGTKAQLLRKIVVRVHLSASPVSILILAFLGPKVTTVLFTMLFGVIRYRCMCQTHVRPQRG